MKEIELVTTEEAGAQDVSPDDVNENAVVTVRSGKKTAHVLVTEACEGSFFTGLMLDDELMQQGTPVSVPYGCVFHVKPIERANIAYAWAMISIGVQRMWPSALQSVLSAVLLVGLVYGHRGSGMVVLALAVSAASFARQLVGR